MTSFEGATGILGGTFDPVHNGHLAVATQCRALLGLAQVRLVPAAEPPHRPPPTAPAADRLAMVRLAVGDREGLVVDDIEVSRGGPSYTVDTLCRLRDSGVGPLVLLLGHDAAVELADWHRAVELPGLAQLVVFNRSGPANGRPLPVGATEVKLDSPAVSATELRRRLAAGEAVSGMLPASVLAYIVERGLYGARR